MLPASQLGSTPTSQRLRANRQFNRATERHDSLLREGASTLGVTAFHSGSISAKRRTKKDVLGSVQGASEMHRVYRFQPLAQDTGYGPQSHHPTLDTAKTRSLAVIGSHIRREVDVRNRLIELLNELGA